MSGTSGDHAFLHELERNVRAELVLAQSGQPAGQPVAPPSEEWLFEQDDAERYEVGLRGLLGAVVGLEEEPPSHVDSATEPVNGGASRATFRG